MLFDEAGFAVSMGILLAVAFAWAFIFVVWALAGWEPWLNPWLAIDSETYYGWEALFVVPVIFSGWMLMSGGVQLLSRRFGGGGSFEATSRLLALSLAVCHLVVLLPSLILALYAMTARADPAWWQEVSRSGPANAIVWLLGTLTIVWLVMLTSIAVRAAHKTRPRPSFLVAIPAVVLYVVFMSVFLR